MKKFSGKMNPVFNTAFKEKTDMLTNSLSFSAIEWWTVEFSEGFSSQISRIDTKIIPDMGNNV